MKKYIISTNLIRVTKNLYNKATSTVLFNSSTGDWFRTTVGVREECVLSPTLFNIFLGRIKTDALEDHEGTVITGGRTIINLRFADDIDSVAGEEEKMAKLVERLDKASTAHGMEISAEKTKLMTNNTGGINTEIKVSGQTLETVTSFKYLGSVITDEGSKPEILSRIAQTTVALTKLKPVWNDRSISLSSQMRLMRSLVTPIFPYVCESWTLIAELKRIIHAMEMRCYRKMLLISHKDYVSNEEVRAEIQQAIGPHEDLLTVVKRRELQWYCHVSRSSGLVKTVLQGTVKGGRRQGRHRKRWEDNIKEWTENREKWRKLVVKSSVEAERQSRLRGR